jgi:D-sedoheptulose 7-phosphate isomerase
MSNIISQSLESHKQTLNAFDSNILNSIDAASKTLLYNLKKNGKIFWIGNGGSASQANHLSAELTGGMYSKKINPFASICLNTDTSFITAWSNDDDFSNIYKRQLIALANKRDVLVSLSTSGNSKNIIKAAEYASKNNISVISLTGQKPGGVDIYADINIKVPSNDTQRIQEMHILIGHILCESIEKNYQKTS